MWESCISRGITIPISITTIAAVSMWHATAASQPAWQLAQLRAVRRKGETEWGGEKERERERERETTPWTDSIDAAQLDCCISIAA